MWFDALSYLRKSKGNYRLHSPFVYDFFEKVIKGGHSEYGEFAERIRIRMLSDHTPIEFEDLGAGSYSQKGKQVKTTIAQLAKKASRRRNEGEFLHRLMRFCQPKRALELGTQLGISTIYQKFGWPSVGLETIEGIPELAEQAQMNFLSLELDIPIHLGNFEEVLAKILKQDRQGYDYILIDGNHTYEATINYFELLLPQMNESGVIVFDDIYWSEGMKKAWKQITEHPDVRVSIDVFRFGICFIRRPQAKEHFMLRNLKLLF
ncbi:MAG: class I SAM-dependent methyltransferase [Bacteroidia bacterium]|nr:class I SAM-dependent methyltransferase [Bacteroidia bacterium]